jgi:hypothetical protein
METNSDPLALLAFDPAAAVIRAFTDTHVLTKLREFAEKMEHYLNLVPAQESPQGISDSTADPTAKEENYSDPLALLAFDPAAVVIRAFTDKQVLKKLREFAETFNATMAVRLATKSNQTLNDAARDADAKTPTNQDENTKAAAEGLFMLREPAKKYFECIVCGRTVFTKRPVKYRLDTKITQGDAAGRELVRVGRKHCDEFHRNTWV